MKILIAVIVVVAISFYVFDTYGSNIYSSLKISVLDFILNDLESYELLNDDTSDKLKLLAEEQFDKVKNLNFSEAYDQVNFFFQEVKLFLEDHNLDEIEFEKLKEVINNEKQK